MNPLWHLAAFGLAALALGLSVPRAKPLPLLGIAALLSLLGPLTVVSASAYLVWRAVEYLVERLDPDPEGSE